MEEKPFEALMREFDFSKAGHLHHADDTLRYVLSGNSQAQGFVYLWVEMHAQEYAIRYVGMAGKSLKARCEQHLGGFRSSPTGKAHAERLRAGFAAGCEYLLYARKCGTGSLLGESDIPMTTVEELAFIKKFKPTWNRAGS